MLFQILVLADFLSHLYLVIIGLGLPESWRILFLISFYLLGKAFLFKDILSILDGVVGFYAFILIFGLNIIFLYYFVIGFSVYKLISLIG